jgi:hypothetical protein
VGIVALQETHCSGTIFHNAIRKLGSKYFLLVEARGFSGDIWVMCNILDIMVRVIKSNFHFLHVQVKEKDMDSWLLTVVYASPRKNERRETWHLIHPLATTTTDPWLVMGDFNEIASPDGKKGGCK